MTENTASTPEISDPNDIAALQALSGATFGPGSAITLPSGLTLTPEQVRELAADS